MPGAFLYEPNSGILEINYDSSYEWIRLRRGKTYGKEEKYTAEIILFMFISQHIYIWRRLCDRDADEKEICG